MKKIFLCLLMAFLPFSAIAEIKMPPMFSDGMVLQRQMPVPVWGWVHTKKDVKVTFAGQTKTSKVAADGRWQITLDPLQASATASEMLIDSGAEKKTIKNIVVGEVWLCSGQSNMDFTVQMVSGKAKNPKYQPVADYIRQAKEKSDDPLLRVLPVPHRTSPLVKLNNFNSSWLKAHPSTMYKFTATGYFYGRELREKLKVPVGLIHCAWSGTRIEPWIPKKSFLADPEMAEYLEKQMKRLQDRLASWDNELQKKDFKKKINDWLQKSHELLKQGKNPPRPPFPNGRPDIHASIPANIYNAMIHPLIPYAMRGAIWYQGEANGGHVPEQYEKHLSALINSWRKEWQQEKFYFYWCQLASFRKPSPTPLDKSGWAEVQNNQRKALKVADTGMAVLNDIGEAEDIHPKNKVDAGKRLSLWALKQIYGQTDLVCSGPLYQSHKISGNKVTITFQSIGSGLMTGKKHLLDKAVETNEPLKQFQICGADRVWKWAEAKIISKDTVEVSHPDISAPVEVRYAWSDNPEGANLYNKEGLPASVFKTEE